MKGITKEQFIKDWELDICTTDMGIYDKGLLKNFTKSVDLLLLAERERCAKIAIKYNFFSVMNPDSAEIARLIREG